MKTIQYAIILISITIAFVAGQTISVTTTTQAPPTIHTIRIPANLVATDFPQILQIVETPAALASVPNGQVPVRISFQKLPDGSWTGQIIFH